MARRIVEGARAARAEPGCRSAIGWIAVVALLASPFIALVPAMSKQYVHSTGLGLPSVTALLVTAQGIGAVAGAVALPGLAIRFGRLTMLRTALFVVPVLLCAYALAPSLPLALVAFVGVGAAYIFVLSGLNTVVQLRAPAEARGRILSIYMMALGLIYPLGAVVQGLLADTHGIRAVTVIGAVALLAVCVLVAFVRPTAFTNLADPTPDDRPGPPLGGVAPDPAPTGGAA
jgi:MFS family permease